MRARYPLATAIAVAIAAGAVELTVRDFGFPDGHLTALERAYAELWSTGRFLAAMAGANFLAMAARPPRSRAWPVASYAALLAALAWALWRCAALAATLEDGGGG